MISWLRRISIKQRLFIFVLMPLVLMVICFLFYYNFSKEMLFNKNMQDSKQRVTMAEKSLSLNALRLEENFLEYSKLAMAEYQETNTWNQIDGIVNNLEAQAIFFYDGKGTLIAQQGEAFLLSDELKKEVQHSTTWLYDQKENHVLFTKAFYEDSSYIGQAVAVYKEETFAPSFMQDSNRKQGLVIMNAKNEILLGQADFKNHTLDITNEVTTMNEKEYYIQKTAIEHTRWFVADLVDQAYVYEEIVNFRNMLLMYSSVSVILLLLFSSVLYHSIYDPIDHILASMHDFDEENLKNSLIVDAGKDEVHILNETFNDLILRINELLTTVQNEQDQRRETQFQLLQAQINPHFLFNTLNTLRYLAILNEDRPVSEGINALSKLLRNTIIDSNEMVTVQEEIENVKSYIIIQKLRYGDIFETAYNIDDDVKYCRILKFLLQPIVENSILHAFEEDREHQMLTIRASTQQNFLKIEIGDNGKGFRLQEEKVNKKLSGIGMKNIQERIHLMYGEQYTMKVESVLNVGTITTLYLPLHKG